MSQETQSEAINAVYNIVDNIRHLMYINGYTKQDLLNELLGRNYEISLATLYDYLTTGTEIPFNFLYEIGSIFNVEMVKIVSENFIEGKNIDKNEIFISYSHSDSLFLEEIKVFMKPLERKNDVIFWDDTKIKAGNKWKKEIDKALLRAGVALFLVSPNFLASDFIMNQEVPMLLRKAEINGTNIIWIPLSHSLYMESPFFEYQAVIDPNTPLDMMEKPVRNKELTKIFQNILRIIRKEV